jgi:hypothetical protein
MSFPIAASLVASKGELRPGPSRRSFLMAFSFSITLFLTDLYAQILKVSFQMPQENKISLAL